MPLEAKIAILILASAGLAFMTRRSLKGLYSHGLYRLLAWIASIALVLLNLEDWFERPLAAHQIASWTLFLFAILAVTYGAISLRRGRVDAGRGDDSLIGIERTTQLVMTGAYRYVRHPMYSSFLLTALGVFLKSVSWAGAVLTGLVIICAVLTARTEEKENILYFGDTYRDYMKRTSMFIPFLI
jgi:protein-S-isoprenylcysteine O-methyltransferase Ste14